MRPRRPDADVMLELYELGLYCLKERKLEPVLGKIVDTAIALSHADFGTIQLLDPKTARLKLAAQRGFSEAWVEFWNSVEEGQGACGSAMQAGDRVIVEDVESSPLFAGLPALKIQKAAGVRAIQSTPIRGGSGKLIGMFSTQYREPHRPDERTLRSLDLLALQAGAIIERAQNDERERDLQRQRDLADHMREFSHIVSHDLKEPIRTAAVLLDLFLRRKTDPSLIKSADKAVKRTLNLLNAVSQYSKVVDTSEGTSSIDAEEILHEAVQNVRSLIEENGGEVSHGKLPIVTGRRGDLVQLFQNLVANAMKYYSPGSAPRLVVGAEPKAGAWLFNFSDNGVGFPTEISDAIFLPFKRFDSQRDSMGMGLAICKRIVLRHAGKIWAESEPGHGTTFWVLLPE